MDGPSRQTDTRDAARAGSRPDRAAGPGRPSRAADRRRQVVDAFVALLSDQGLDTVTLDDVAHRSGISRSLMRHHVGNRDNLIRVTIEQLVEGYRSRIDDALGATPDADALIAHLFSTEWSSTGSSEDRALDVLLQEAVRADSTRRAVRSAYEALIDLAASAVGRSRPDLAPSTARDLAASVVALAEQNVVMVQLGFGPGITEALQSSARSLVESR